MAYKFLNPLHLIFALFSIVWACMAFLLPINLKIDISFLLICNITLWFVTCLPTYLFYISLKSKRSGPSLNAISSSVMIKLFVIVIFIVCYHVLCGGIPVASLLLAFCMYLIYSLVHVKVMTALNSK